MNRGRIIPIVSVIALGAAVLPGCKVGPNYKTPEVALPGEFSTSGASTNNSAGNITRWWGNFGDAKLDSLITRAVEGNLDLRIAAARITEARAIRGINAADWFPQVDAGAGYEHNRQSLNSVNNNGGTFKPKRDTDHYDAGFDATWELDVFGHTARSVEASDADIQSAIEQRRDVLVILVAEVARNYIDLRGAQRELTVTRSNLKSQQETLGLTDQRAKAGIATGLDVARSEAQVATTAAVIPSLEQRARQDMHQIAVLLGRDPAALVSELSVDGPLPVTAIPQVPVGLPSDLLRRRPDIRRAERNLASATAQIGVATADLFPRFSLTGSFGWESQRAENLFDDHSFFYGVGPAVRLPIFNAGRIRANIAATDAVAQQALSSYEQTVLTSLQDVEDSLIAYEKEQARRDALAQAVDSNRRAVQLSQELNNRGLVDFLSVLDAQRALFATEDLLVQSETRISVNLVALYKSLGGGWEDEASAPTTQPR